MRWFSPSSKNETTNYNTSVENNEEVHGKGHGNFIGSENVRQQTGSDRSVVGNKNLQNIAKSHSASGKNNNVSTGHSASGKNNKVANANSVAGSNNEYVRGNSVGGTNNQVARSHSVAGEKNRVNTSTGFSNAGTVEGRGNVQNVGRGDAFQGADMSHQNAKGNISHIGDHSTIGGDFYNRDFDLELNAEAGATINYTAGDSGVSEAISDLGRALGRTSYGGVQALDNSISGQQKVEITKEILFAIVAGFVGVLMFRN